MRTIIYFFVTLIARIHNDILSWNDGIENSFTDKELHFIIVGVLGIALILILHPLFLWLAKRDHTMVISFLYVFTVLVVLTFAIEIGQGYYGTGAMEFDDVTYGIAGFFAFFIVFLALRGIVHLILRHTRQ